jgi:hypothetical protein
MFPIDLAKAAVTSDLPFGQTMSKTSALVSCSLTKRYFKEKIGNSPSHSGIEQAAAGASAKDPRRAALPQKINYRESAIFETDPHSGSTGRLAIT